MQLPEKVQIVEVGPRDGFQNIKDWIPTELKLEIIEGLINAGFKKIEITSFVHPKAIPQMKDAKDVAKKLLKSKKKDIVYNALVPNLYGAKVAWDMGVEEITYVISASEQHNKANVNRTVAESVSELTNLTKEIPDVQIKLDIATVFGCPYMGNVPVEDVFYLIDKALELGITDICLCDTIGIANPLQVSEVLEKIANEYPRKKFSLHLHDTRGMGLANVLVALEYGITVFETALGGLGGCPFAPGAAGNIASEDLINMLENMGIDTGIDLSRLLETVKIIKHKVKSDLTGHLVYVDA